ncbi:hypothetical protein FZEAL_1463 [Fusarium zealandicum]|uniref:GED domain-containing protein n=1 Tax=Fusarium zealandicum TaxID=1053134 RepID=A0A8H4XPX0_9HYPO|nr:hypothetical protein FZEAL_1463 [Fusarium zealandicum]
MAGQVDTFPQAPMTPPPTVVKLSSSYEKSDKASLGHSPADSGVWDLNGDPSKSPTPSPRVKITVDQHDADEQDPFRGNAQTVSTPKPSVKGDSGPDTADLEAVPEDPFDNQHNRILFDAIDKLQSVGSSDLSIPQLVIVGGQSSGKSSLLQSLTGIPFPVNSGCCTRWPTRIVSRRTKPGTKDSFRITIEPPEVRIPGMKPAPEDMGKFVPEEGEFLTKETFIETVNEVSHWMGISTGIGPNRKNFASEVLKVELSGPSRTYFSILDLPGTFRNSSKVNKEDPCQVEAMIIEYMKRRDSIVICVSDAPTDFYRQDAFTLATDHVDQQRLVGVFTKCDMIQNEPEAAKEVVSIATNDSSHDVGSLRKGWFLVRNRADKDGDSFDLRAAEKSLFDKAPWNIVPQNRLGSAALKAYLGEVLSSRIRACFPELCKGIRSRLDEKRSQRQSLGEPRETHSAKQQYAISAVSQFQKFAGLALDRPEGLPESVRGLRWEVSNLNRDFGQFMRSKGATWDFLDKDLDPYTEIVRSINPNAATEAPVAARMSTKESASLDEQFPHCSDVQDSGALIKSIEEHLDIYQAAQLPGVINPIVYHKVYQKQVAKWDKITQTHLARVIQAVVDCSVSILDLICPSNGDTNRLRQELENVLQTAYNSSCQEVESRRKHACDQETKCERLETTAPGFGQQIVAWRQLRFFKASRKTREVKEGNEELIEFIKYFDLVHPSLRENMIYDVHDVLKVYYKITMETFIRTITHSVVEDFISDENGPLKRLSSNWVLGLGEEELDALCREEEVTIMRRVELQSEIEKLEGALAIVDRARQQTAGLERV